MILSFGVFVDVVCVTQRGFIVKLLGQVKYTTGFRVIFISPRLF